MSNIEVIIDDKEVRALLDTLAKQVQNTRPLMRALSADLKDAVLENFGQEGRPKWRPLSPRTIKQREKNGHWPGKILQQTGQLKRSITAQSTDTEAIVGTNLKYAPTHHFGRRNIPARPFMQIDKSDIFQFEKTIYNYIYKTL